MGLEDIKIVWSIFGGPSLLVPVAQLSIAKGCMWYSSKLSNESSKSDGFRSLRLSRNASLVRAFGMGLGVVACGNAALHVGTSTALLSFGAAIAQSGMPDDERKRSRLVQMIGCTGIAGVLGCLAVGVWFGKRSFGNFRSAYHIHQRVNRSLEQSVRKTDSGGTL